MARTVWLMAWLPGRLTPLPSGTSSHSGIVHLAAIVDTVSTALPDITFHLIQLLPYLAFIVASCRDRHGGHDLVDGFIHPDMEIVVDPL